MLKEYFWNIIRVPHFKDNFYSVNKIRINKKETNNYIGGIYGLSNRRTTEKNGV